MTVHPPKVYAIDGVVPVVDPTAFVHPDAVLIGDVIVEAGCYIGPCASLRGDFGRLIVREGSNVQDNCTLHSMPGFDSVVGRNGHIGHGVVLHSARLEASVLVGMNAVIMDNAVLGESSMVAACAFVKAGMEIPARSLVAGVPARVLRPLSDQELAWKFAGTRTYQDLTRRSLATLVETEALTAVEPGRKRFDLPGVLPLIELRKLSENSG